MTYISKTMGFLNLFEEEEQGRKIYGVYNTKSAALKVILLDFLLQLPLSETALTRVTLLRSMYNIEDTSLVTQTTTLDPNIVYIGTGEPTPTTQNEVLSMTPITITNNIFVLPTGTQDSKFKLVIAPSKTILSIVDSGAMNLPLLQNYVLVGTIPITDGITTENYNTYVMVNAIPYSSSHDHLFTTN